LYEGKIHKAYTMRQLLSNIHFKIDYGKCPVVNRPRVFFAMGLIVFVMSFSIHKTSKMNSPMS
jgi:hypothetical protein